LGSTHSFLVHLQWCEGSNGSSFSCFGSWLWCLSKMHCRYSSRPKDAVKG
jgi:hypothetical protein